MRKYSNKQEKRIAELLGGNKVPNSGATDFRKGDVSTQDFLIECKTSAKPKKSVSIKKEWLEKNKEESFVMNKQYSILAFDFGDGEDYVILDILDFLDLLEAKRQLKEMIK